MVSYVIEETEEMAILEEEVVTVIRNRFTEMGAKKEFLAKLFKEMDVRGTGSLSLKEVREAMTKMGVHLTLSKFKRLFRLMDASRTGGISYPEFHNLIFPEDEIREKAKANALAMKHHASKKQLYLKKEQNLYNDTFEGQFHGYLRNQEVIQQQIHQQQRTQGAKTMAHMENQRISRIKAGAIHKLADDRKQSMQMQKVRVQNENLVTR